MRNDVRRLYAPAKLLERILWLPPVRNGLPVAFRARTDVRFPVIKICRFKVTVLLPIELARFIPSLARFIRLWRSQNGRTKRKPKPATFDDIVALTSDTSKKKVKAMDEPQNGNRSNNQANKPKPSDNGQSEKSILMLSVTCHKCQRTIEIPPEWIEFARCLKCGKSLSEIVTRTM